MPSSLLEIVDLGNGEIVLQRADDDSEPLLTIQFSEEAQVYLMDNGLEVAKAMIQSGIETASVLAGQPEITSDLDAEFDPELDQDFDVESPRVIH